MCLMLLVVHSVVHVQSFSSHRLLLRLECLQVDLDKVVHVLRKARISCKRTHHQQC
jgi:hypothetical protein